MSYLEAQNATEHAKICFLNCDSACFVLAGIDSVNLLQAVEVALLNKNGCKPVYNYIDTNVSDKVVKIIQSYTGVVNKMVWRKY